MMRELRAARFHRVSSLAWLVLLAAAATPVAGAQGFRIRPTAQPEIRAFASAASDWSVGAGVGFNVPAGYYLRVAPMLIAGRRLSATPRDFARFEVVGRFSLDPFRQSRWGPWAGAGLAGEWERDVAGRARVMLALGTDLPGTSGWKPTVELSVGGGTRVSLGFKPVRRAGR